MAKKTTEQQKEALEKTIKEAEKLKKIPVNEDDESDEAKKLQKKAKKDIPEDPKKPEDEVKKGKDPKKAKSPKKADPPKKPDPETPKVNYKKKFSESSREAQKIAAKNKLINKAIDDGKDTPEPTDEEMKAEYPDWDIMEDFMKKIATESTVGKRFRENMTRAREEGQKVEKWNDKVEKFTEDPETLTKNPDLEGRLDEFKVFATDDANTSVSFDILIPAFLHNSNVKPKNKGGMFPKGSAGPSDPVERKKAGTITMDEAMTLKKVDYDKYKAKLKAGLIESDI